MAAGKRTQADLEDRILALLSSASGSLLDNVALIDTLDASKTTWEEVNASLAIAEETARELEAAAAAYRPCSVRAAALYFVLNELASVDPMYQFSLDAYMQLFRLSLKTSPKAEELGERIKALNDHHTYAVRLVILIITLFHNVAAIGWCNVHGAGSCPLWNRPQQTAIDQGSVKRATVA